MFINPFRKQDINRRRRSSNIFSKKEDTAKVINKRLRIVTLVVCLLFLVIGLRLAQLQLIDNEEYALKLEAFTAKKQTFSSPRGNIYDANNVVLAESKKSLSIYYYPKEGISAKEEWELAEKFVDEIGINLKKTNDSGVEVDAITERQLKDMYYLYQYNYKLVTDNFNSLLSEEELAKANDGKLTATEVYNLKIERLELPVLDERTKKVYLTKMLMGAAPENEFKTVLEGASQEQASKLVERNAEFPGFKFMNDWTRVYYEDNNPVVKTILGSISSQTQGIPAEYKDYYLGLGYTMNQRVGISGLEKEYEEWLKGTKSSYNISTDEDGLAVLELDEEGKKGYDLTLTLDMELQKRVDAKLKEVLSSASGEAKREYLNSLHFVAINPNTGEVLAMDSVYRDDEGTLYSSPTGTYLDANRAGSVVKMATLYMGLDTGRVTEGEYIEDAPLSIKGTPIFKSYQTHGLINDEEAIAVSSNVYMATIAIRMAGGDYVANEPLYYDESLKPFETMRSYYNMFGLGVKTGIDLPDESVGSIGGSEERGKIMHLAIGQYDTYTTMQLAQYVSTVANGGKRVQPHLLKDVTEVNDRESIVYAYQPKILSTLLGSNVAQYLGRAQVGMRGCVNGINNKSAFCPLGVQDSNSGTQLAAKTGTAEDIINGVEVANSTMVAYGPYENPEIAFACFAPGAEIVSDNMSTNICGEIIGEISKYYFENK